MLTATLLAWCATRSDGHGVTRVGVGLWGFGDPPVNWNLDWPRLEPAELQPATYPELPPLRTPPADLPSRLMSGAIDDNRDHAQGRDPCREDAAPTAQCVGGARTGALAAVGRGD